MKKPQTFLSKNLPLWLCLCISLTSNYTRAGILYWDDNGTGTPTSGAWDNSTKNWAPSSTLTTSTTNWTANDLAVFTAGSTSAGSITLTVNAAISFGGLDNNGVAGTACNLTVVNGGSGSLTLASGAQGFYVTGGESTTWNIPIGGSGGMEPQGPGTVNLNVANTFTGGFIFANTGLVNITNANVFGTGPVSLGGSGGALVNNGPYAVVITNTFSGGSFNLNIVPNTSGLTFSGPWTLGATSPVIGTGATAGNTLTISGAITGTGNLNAYNAGNLLLTGVNTYTGSTSNSCPLTIGGAGQLGSGSYGGKITNNSSFTYNSSANQTLTGVISGTGSLTQKGAGTLVLSNANTYTGITTVAGGILNLDHSESVNSAGPLGKQADTGNNSLVMSGGILQYSSNNSHDYSGRMSTAAGQQYNIDVNGRAITYASALTSSGGQLTLSDTAGNGSLILSAANTYTGGTTVKSGTLSVNTIADSGASAIGNSGTFTFAGGTLQYTGAGAATTSRQITGIQSTTSGIDLPSGNLTLARISGANSFTINQFGSGTLTLANTADNAFLGMNVLGGTVVLDTASSPTVHGLGTASTVGSGGTLQLGGSGGYDVFAGASVTVSNGGVFDMNGQSLSAAGISSFTFAGTGILGNGSFINSAANTTSTLVVNGGFITVSTNTSFGGAGNLVIPEPIIGTVTLMTKVGSGTVTFEETNNYTGPTTVQAGTLAYGPNSAGGPTDITVDSGATLDCATNYTILVQSITLNSGAAAAFDAIGGSSPPVGSFFSFNNITLNGNTMVINNSGSPLSAGTYRLLSCNGTLTGTANPTPTVTGSGIAPGYVGSISTTTGAAGHVDLVVQPLPVFTGLSSQTNTYGTGAISLRGNLAAGSTYPAIGEVVSATINGHTINGTVEDNIGDFDIIYNSTLATDPVGSYTVTYSYAGDSSLGAATDSSTQVSVTQAPLNIAANNQTKTYGQTVASGVGSTNFTATGLQNGETVGSVTLFISFNAGASNGVPGNYNITPSSAIGGTFNPANYSLSYAVGLLTVNPATLTVTADSLSRPYGATNSVLTVTYTNFVNGEALGTSDVTGSPVLTTDADTNSDVGAYVITNTIGTLTSSNYTFSLVNGILSVTNAISTNVVTASTNPALPGTAVVFSATLSTIAPSTAVPTNVVQFLIDGTNYGLAIYPSNGVASITNAGLSHGYHIIEADYDGDTNSVGATNIVGSTNTFNELINTPPVAGPATYSRLANMPLNINVSDLLTNATDADGDAITLLSVSSVSTNGATIVTNSGVITYTPPATNGNVTDAFTYVVEDSFGATNAGTVTVTVSISSPTFSNLGAPFSTYGATSVALSGTISSGSIYPANGEPVSATINGHTVIGAVIDNAGDFTIVYNDPSLATDAVASYPITYSYGGDSSLNPANDSSTSLTVNQAPLVVTATGQSKTYGQTVVFGSGSTNFNGTGLQNGETIGSVTLAVSGNGGASNAPVSGSPYTITPSAATAGTFNPANYSISYNGGLLTVGPASLTVSADNLSRPYGAANPVFTATYTNFVNGETLATSDVQGAPALVTAATTNSDVDDYIITNSVGTLTSSNYAFNLVNGVLTVTNAISTNVVTASTNPALPGTAVVFNATLSTIAPSTAVPTNVVQFLIDGIDYGSAVTPSNGVASITNASLSHGYHIIEADYDGDTNSVGATNIVGSTNTFNELINTPPVAGPATYSRLANSTLNIPISGLLTNASDADGDAITLLSVSSLSTNGATIVTNSSVITYMPPATNGNVTDVFTYVVEDAFGATNAGTVTVTIQSEDNGPAVNITGLMTRPDGSVLISFAGVANYYYLIEATTNLSPPVTWTVLSTNQADTNGLFQFSDSGATNYPARFYRSAVPPGY